MAKGKRSRIAKIAIAAASIIVVALGAFPWGILKGSVEKALAKEFGRPVSIGAMKREGLWSLRPKVVLRDIVVPQAAWAGEGEMARVEAIEIRFLAPTLLAGKLVIDEADIAGMRLDLVRDEDGRKNWKKEDANKQGGKSGGKSGGRPSIRRLTISESSASYRDDKRDRSLAVNLSADGSGVRIAGEGFIHGRPVKVGASGAPVIPKAAGKNWPFHAEIVGEAVGMTFDGEMDGPLDIGHFTADATAHADDLALIDAVIEAGLMPTQPVKLAAKVRRRSPDWIISDLKGSIGRSDIAGEATIEKRGGRTRIEGRLDSEAFDFDDLASEEGRRIAREKAAKYGMRLFPDTAIDLDNVDKTDGTLAVSARKLLWRGQSPFRSLSGTIKVERQLLTIDDAALGLTHGEMKGRVSIDQRIGGPTLAFELETDDARFGDFFPGAGIDAPLAGHIRLTGVGRTVREAVGRSTGSIAIVAREGVIPAKTASLLGQDIGRGLTTGDSKEAQLNCIVARLNVTEGKAEAAPVVIDTSRAVTSARGSIDMASEALSLEWSGAPKQESVMRLEGAVPVRGTIKEPDIKLPKQAKSPGGILEMVGEAIVGDQDPIAGAADCDALAAEALR